MLSFGINQREIFYPMTSEDLWLFRKIGTYRQNFIEIF